MIGMLLALMLPTSAWADETTPEVPEVFAGYHTWYEYRDESFSIEGKGTLDNPIVINTAGELAQLAWIYNTAKPVDNIEYGWKNKVIVIGSDINLEKTVDGQRVQWIPIGYGNVGFEGAFLGINSKESLTANSERHQIKGMYIHLTADDLAKAKYYQFGLFSVLSGYVGYLDITDASISLNFSSMNKSRQVGILSGNSTGSGNYRTQPIQVNATTPQDVKVAIESVGVKGDIDVVSQNSTYSTYLGGISGVIDHHGVFHSTASVNINTTNCKYVGGICGYVNTNKNAEYITSIVDCLVQATINSSYPDNNNEDIANIGGICGIMNYSPYTVVGLNKIEASSSMGSISVSGNAYVGGICGFLSQVCSIGGCTSSALLSGGKYLGGICGYIYDNTAFPPDDVHEMIVPLEDCVFSGHIDANQTEYAGGLCGYSMEETDLHINSSLFAGTMTIGNAQHAAAIVGYTPKPDGNVGGCYYDASLFTGNVVNDQKTHSSIRGLTTDVLTSGTLNSVSMLNQDESTKYYFTLRKGYYPRMVSNRAYTPYYEQRNGAVTFSAILNSDAASESESPSCLFNSGSWLCSVPVNIPKGDTAYDFVTQVIAPSKNAAWTELNRTITVNSKVEYQKQSCIKISNDTAYAVANGTFITKITVNPDRPTAIWNRPLPISGTKQLLFTSTVDQVWDGSIATEFAAGSGKKEDPYIIKNGAQLAYAVKNNKEGEWYKQICDITLNKDLVNNGIALPSKQWFTDITWKARYNGDNHYVRGVEMPHESGLFGNNIEANAEVTNLGVVDCYLNRETGAFAYQMNGKITNCIAEGLATPNNASDNTYYYLGYCGGFCALIGNTNPEAVIEDCVSAVGCDYFMMDYTPFVSLSDNNHGIVRHCLFVVPVGSDDATFSGTRSSASGHDYIKDCYWLKGYEPLNTGYTLEEICNTLASRSSWVINNGYFPMLKSFANSDMGKLLSVPFRTDVDYVFDEENNMSSNYLLGFSNQLLFEPGSAEWSINTTHIEADGDMGIIAPVSASFTPQAADPKYYNVRTIIGLGYLKGVLGKYQHYIPMRSSDQNVTPGITFVDNNARDACLTAFDSNGNGSLSLAELKAVTTEQTLTAFQTATAKKIVKFPEFRFFKAVTNLTSQLNGLSKLEEVKLPYALETLGSDAFKGCTSLIDVTIPGKVDVVEPHPFYGSVIENVSVDPFNENFVSRDGILFDTNNVLVAYPNGRTGEEAVITGTINEIAKGAIYKVEGVKRLYFETDDYETVPYLKEDGIVSANGELIDVYVSDATYESVLMQGYYKDGTWDDYIKAGKLHCYYPLKVGSAKATTMYIGFDTQLPATLTPYIVTKANGESGSTDEEDNEPNTAYLREMEREVPSRSPVVIFAKEAGTYRLEPLDKPLGQWLMYKNELNGVGRDGMPVNQGDSDRGYILTLGYNKEGVLGFFYYLGGHITPYHAYLTYNETSSGAKYHIVFLENETTGISEAVPLNDKGKMINDKETWYTLEGVKLNGKPTKKGIYILNGRKRILK